METKTDQKHLRTMHPRVREMLFTAKRFLRNPLSVIGLSLIVIFGVIAILAPVLEPPKYRDPFKIPHNGYRIEPSPPSAEHPLGRPFPGDAKGRMKPFHGQSPPRPPRLPCPADPK